MLEKLRKIFFMYRGICYTKDRTFTTFRDCKLAGRLEIFGKVDQLFTDFSEGRLG
jgi:hypothetical protein